MPLHLFNFNGMNNSVKIKMSSRIMLVIAAALLTASMFVAIWRIELDAPQYPEGLALLIFSNKLGGDVDIINGLNHYIGMQTLHAENFIEFSIMRYIIGAYALFALVVAALGNKKLLQVLLAAFVLFGIVAMIDFYRWNYDYGHNLDPNAAIKVPGMAYQPPLIGYKQLLNFGAYSVPDFGGWMFIGAGILMVLALAMETFLAKPKTAFKASMSVVALMLFTSCSQSGPKPVKLNVDNCEFCKMTIADAKFAAQVVTAKGRNFMFDDVGCMQRYKKDNEALKDAVYYISDFTNPDLFIATKDAILIQGDQIKSPMGGGIAAFSNKQTAETYLAKFSASYLQWQ